MVWACPRAAPRLAMPDQGAVEGNHRFRAKLRGPTPCSGEGASADPETQGALWLHPPPAGSVPRGLSSAMAATGSPLVRRCRLAGVGSRCCRQRSPGERCTRRSSWARWGPCSRPAPGASPSAAAAGRSGWCPPAGTGGSVGCAHAPKALGRTGATGRQSPPCPAYRGQRGRGLAQLRGPLLGAQLCCALRTRRRLGRGWGRRPPGPPAGTVPVPRPLPPRSPAPPDMAEPPGQQALPAARRPEQQARGHRPPRARHPAPPRPAGRSPAPPEGAPPLSEAGSGSGRAGGGGAGRTGGAGGDTSWGAAAAPSSGFSVPVAVFPSARGTGRERGWPGRGTRLSAGPRSAALGLGSRGGPGAGRSRSGGSEVTERPGAPEGEDLARSGENRDFSPAALGSGASPAPGGTFPQTHQRLWSGTRISRSA